jgi:hypothetical protein
MKIITLKREEIDQIFETATSQEDYLLRLYALVIPNFDSVEKVQRWPACSNELWLYIAEKAIEFDKLHQVKTMPGGAWMNCGFSTLDTLEGSLPVS